MKTYGRKTVECHEHLSRRFYQSKSDCSGEDTKDKDCEKEIRQIKVSNRVVGAEELLPRAMKRVSKTTCISDPRLIRAMMTRFFCSSSNHTILIFFPLVATRNGGTI